MQGKGDYVEMEFAQSQLADSKRSSIPLVQQMEDLD